MMMDVDSDMPAQLEWETGLAGKILNNVRACATCRKTLEDYSRFKNCATCREKNRAKQRLALQRRQERNLWAMEALAGLSDEEGDDSGVEENHAMRPGGAPSVKKKPKSILELDGKERDVALLEMKNGLKRKFGKKMLAAPSKVILSQFATCMVIENTIIADSNSKQWEGVSNRFRAVRYSEAKSAGILRLDAAVLRLPHDRGESRYQQPQTHKNGRRRREEDRAGSF